MNKAVIPEDLVSGDILNTAHIEDALCGQLEITPDELYNNLLAGGEKVIVIDVEHVPSEVVLASMGLDPEDEDYSEGWCRVILNVGTLFVPEGERFYKEI